MVETPLTPLNPFAESPQESAVTANVEAMARVFSFTPPTVLPAAAGGGGPTTTASGTPVSSSIQIRSHFPSPHSTGSLYTTGLNAQGYPELIAQGVPRHRAPLVVKNMYFLAGRMLQGIPVQGGHRSTDHDYRVSISTGPSHTLILLPFYHDCEEWGSFPPAPQQERTRRNRLLAAAWFPNNHDTYDATDAAYLLEHVEHFARLLQLPDLARINATMPLSLQQLVHGQISSRARRTTTSNTTTRTTTTIGSTRTTRPPSSLATTTITTKGSIQNFPAASPLGKRSVALQDQSNIPPKRQTTTTTTVQERKKPALSKNQQLQPRQESSWPATRTCHIVVDARSAFLPPSSLSSTVTRATTSTTIQQHKTRNQADIMKKIHANSAVTEKMMPSRHPGAGGMMIDTDNKSWSAASYQHALVHSLSQTTRDHSLGSPAKSKKARGGARDSRVRSVLQAKHEIS